MSDLFELQGFHLNELIQEGSKNILYRGIRERDNLPIVAKILRNPYPMLHDISRLEYEYHIASHLEHEGIIQVYELLDVNQRKAIIAEDFGGIPLSDYLPADGLPLIEFLEFALRLVDILEYIHQSQVIHKDIKPQNILVNPKTKEIKLTDFSIATKIQREKQTIFTMSALEGTLGYIAPEQTGRMNRDVDYRSDIYSLGASFYQMLTGRLLFQSTDPLELVHSHIAKKPLAPDTSRPEIPTVLSAIVLKLLAKNAENRYQTTQSLRQDLTQCLNQYQASNTIVEFSIAQGDISEQFQIPQKLYGREKELEQIVQSIQRVGDASYENGSSSNIELLLVSGAAGIGKSMLIREIPKLLPNQKGYFIGGKFEQFSQNIPYSALNEAFENLSKQILAQSNQDIDDLSTRLLRNLGANARIITEIIPSVELIIGEQEPVPSLAPVETQNRFNRVFEQFVASFANKEHPLIVFLDDLQWVDSASLKLVELLLNSEQIEGLLLILAYRDQEVNSIHPFVMMLDVLKAKGVQLKELALQQLDFPPLLDLTVDALHCETQKAQALARVIFDKTQGNPFFFKQFFMNLHQENLLIFDHEKQEWRWDIKELEALNVSDNVVDFLIGDIQKFPETTQQLLQLASCIGNTFDLETLATIAKQSSSLVIQTLWKAFQRQIVQALGGDYRLAYEREKTPETDELSLDVTCRFQHDRIQQAAYASISAERKEVIHLQIGQLMLEHVGDEIQNQQKLMITEHLNKARNLITHPQERLKLVKLNLELAHTAKAATAYEEAHQFLLIGQELLPDTAWLEHYELTYDLYLTLAECKYLLGKLDEAEILCEQLLENTKSDHHTVDVWILKIIQYLALNKWSESIDAGRTALALLDIELPEEASQELVGAKLQEVSDNMANRTIEDLLDLPIMTDLNKKALLKLLINLVSPIYVLKPDLIPVIVLEMVNISLLHGNSEESAYAYDTYGLLQGAVFGQYRIAYEFGKLALALNEKFQDRVLEVKVKATFCTVINHWVMPLKTDFPIYIEGYQAGLEVGDLLFAGYCCVALIVEELSAGKNLAKLYSESEDYYHFLQKTHNPSQSLALITRQMALGLQGFTEDKLSLNDENFDELTYLEGLGEFYHGHHWYHLCKAQLYFLYSEYEDALRMIELSGETKHGALGQFSIAEHNFYHSLILASLYANKNEDERATILQQITTNQEQMAIWAENAPANFKHKHLVVQAEMSRLKSNHWETLSLYDQAIAATHESGFVQDIALVNELAAQFFLSENKTQIAHSMLSKAYQAYQAWGAIAKVKDMKIVYPFLTQVRVKNSYSMTSTVTAITTDSETMLDLASIIKVYQAISSEIELDKLLMRIIRILIENAGAEKGLLILNQNETFQIQASASSESDKVEVLQALPIENSSLLSEAIVRYVFRTQEYLLLEQPYDQSIFANDSYLQNKQPFSVLCFPLRYKDHVSGVLYLENNIIRNVFSLERIEMLDFLLIQAAISLDNAMLYRDLSLEIAERKQTQAALAELNEQLETRVRQRTIELEAANKEVRQFAYIVSHDLRAPLVNIHGFSGELHAIFEQLKDIFPDIFPLMDEDIQQKVKLALEEDGPEALGFITSSVELINHFVDTVLQLSRIGRRVLQIDTVVVIDIVESTIQSIAHQVEEKSAEILVQTLPNVRADKTSLSQIFGNILTNAVIYLDPERPGKIEIFAEEDDEYVTFCIKDNGRGIAKEGQNQVFELFRRAGADDVKGEGIGMVYVQAQVQRHGGRIWFDSELGVGTTFSFTIAKNLKLE